MGGHFFKKKVDDFSLLKKIKEFFEILVKIRQILEKSAPPLAKIARKVGGHSEKNRACGAKGNDAARREKVPPHLDYKWGGTFSRKVPPHQK